MSAMLKDTIKYLPLDDKFHTLRYERRWRLLGDLILSLKKHKLKPAQFVGLLRGAALGPAAAGLPSSSSSSSSQQQQQGLPSALGLKDSICHIGVWISRNALSEQLTQLVSDDIKPADINALISALDPLKRGQVALWELAALLAAFSSYFEELRTVKPKSDFTMPGLGSKDKDKDKDRDKAAAAAPTSKYGLVAHDHSTDGANANSSSAAAAAADNDYRAQAARAMAERTTGAGVVHSLLAAAAEELQCCAELGAVRGKIVPVAPGQVPVLAVEQLLCGGEFCPPLSFSFLSPLSLSLSLSPLFFFFSLSLFSLLCLLSLTLSIPPSPLLHSPPPSVHVPRERAACVDVLPIHPHCRRATRLELQLQLQLQLRLRPRLRLRHRLSVALCNCCSGRDGSAAARPRPRDGHYSQPVPPRG